MKRQIPAALAFGLALLIAGTFALEAMADPPPQAPAHGWRAKHQYRYYPNASCYYDTGRKLWFYIEYGGWRVGASIPAELKARLGSYVTIGLDTDQPYDDYEKHQKEYPPEKQKQKKK